VRVSISASSLWTKVSLTNGRIPDYIYGVAKGTPHIAVVDDDEPIRKALVRLLRASDFTVESYSSGQEFLASLKGHPPDCIVLDFQMPQVNGLDVLNNLRAKRVTTPVVIITAHDEPIVRANCLAAGACAYLCKPIDEVVLRRAIADAIG
jgi:FixJ family two-component response regulator